MSRTVILQSRVDGAVAARVRVEAESAGMSVSDWIAQVLRREVLRGGPADALARRGYELAATLGYMLRSLMIDAMGAEACEQAIDKAADAAAADLEHELERAAEIP
ncbi:MAG TPA: hypothetical protein VHR45_19385 [Thermoanaerobaculia bacterium]|nr:hypothetical protein [Thermoanaerobaculia bacterium]